METFYRDILRTAWQMVRRHKGLWLFGIFAAIIAEEIETVVRNYFIFADRSLSRESITSFFQADSTTGLLSVYRDLLVTAPFASILTFAVIVLLLALGIWLIVVSVVAIVHVTNATVTKNKYNWGEAFGAGVAYFWPSIALMGIVKGVDYLLLIIVGIASVWLFLGSGSFLGILLVLIMLAVSIVLSLILKYALGFVVLKDQSVTTAIKKGWDLLMKNWIVSIEMAVVQFVISIVIGLALVLVAVLIAVPFLLLIFILNSTDITTGITVLFTVGTLIILLIIMAVGGALGAFRYASWTIVFIRLLEGKGTSKIERIAARLQKRSA